MPAGNVVEVRMITTLDGASGIFKPAAVTVKRGDTVRFVTEGRTLHNVSFPPSENPGRTIPQQSPGPYLTAPNTFFDLSTASMEPGKYNFQCDPHAAMGMKGTLTIR